MAFKHEVCKGRRESGGSSENSLARWSPPNKLWHRHAFNLDPVANALAGDTQVYPMAQHNRAGQVMMLGNLGYRQVLIQC